MEKTLENKAKFFAQYWAQKVLRYSFQTDDIKPLNNVSDNFVMALKDAFLELKPLSQITREEAIEIAKIIYGDTEADLRFNISEGYDKNGIEIPFKEIICIEVQWYCKHPEIMDYLPIQLIQIDTEENDIINSTFEEEGLELKDDSCDNILHVYDLIRSKGFALPFMGLSVKQQIQYGWVRLKTD
jgi:hypothetical protein